MTYAATILADSPTGFWRLNDASGSTAVDSSGNGHTGTYEGAFTLAQSPAVQGDGAAASVTLAGAGTVALPSLSLSPPFSLECWVYPTGDAGTSTGYASLLGWGGPVSGAHRILWFAASGQVLVQMGGGNLSPVTTVSYGQWTHLGYVADGTKETVFINGQQAAQQANAAASWTGAFYAGTYGALGGAYQLKGSLEEIAVYPTALSGARWLAHYNAADRPVTPPGGLGSSTVNYPTGLLSTIPGSAMVAVASGYFTAFPPPWASVSSDPGIQIQVTNNSLTAPVAPILMDAWTSHVDGQVYYYTMAEMSTVQPGTSNTEIVECLPCTQMVLALPYLSIGAADIAAGWTVDITAQAV